jgi:hypothetical protein
MIGHCAGFDLFEYLKCGHIATCDCSNKNGRNYLKVEYFKFKYVVTRKLSQPIFLKNFIDRICLR